jgi:RNA polymerase primary sigma factor
MPSVAAQQVSASNADQARWAKICKRYPALSRDEERSLIVRAQAGDSAARQKLLNHNLSWCVMCARKLATGGAPFDDVVQEGVEGLIRALETFDVKRELRFSTYAMWWIRVRQITFLRSARSVVRPRRETNAVADFSLDTPIGDDDNDATRLDLLEDDAASPEEQFVSSDHDRHVRQALGRLRKRIGNIGWDIIHSRLVKSAGEEDTLEIVGNRHGVSRERIRQVEMKTIALLRRVLPEMLTAREGAYQARLEREISMVTLTPVERARRKLILSNSPTAQRIAAEAEAASKVAETEEEVEGETAGLLTYPAGPRDPLVAEPCPPELIVAHVHRVFPNLPGAIEEAAVDVAQGLGLKDSAAKRGVALSTAHSRRKRMFEATGAHYCDEVTSALLAAALQQLASSTSPTVERCENGGTRDKLVPDPRFRLSPEVAALVASVVKMADAEDGEVPGVMHVPAPNDGFDFADLMPTGVQPSKIITVPDLIDQKIIARAAHLLPTPDDDITARLQALRDVVHTRLDTARRTLEDTQGAAAEAQARVDKLTRQLEQIDAAIGPTQVAP